MRTFILIILCLSILVSPNLSAETARITNASAHLQAIDIDLVMDGVVRETRIYTLGFSFREQLAARLDGAILIGYLDVNQQTNPIVTAENTSGGYLGFDLRGQILETEKFDLFSRFAYRYAETKSQLDAQEVQWHWHEINLSLESQTKISKQLYVNISMSYMDLDGQEKASGDLNQRLNFDQNDSLTGHIGLQLSLDHNGQIILEWLTGSMQGARFVFMRDF